MDGRELFRSVLIIEDDPSHALIIKRALASFATEVFSASTMAEGTSLVKIKHPALVITDLNLPDTSGVKHVASLIELCKGAPVLVLTSSTSIEDAVKAMHLGASDYIVKSFDKNFNEVMALTLQRLKSAQELRQAKAKLEQEMTALRIAIENGQDGMAVLSGDGVVQYHNSAFDRFISLSKGGISKAEDILGPNVKSQIKLQQDLLSKVSSLGQGAVWTSEINFIDDSEAAFDLSLSVLERREGKDATLVIWLRDTTERKRREKFQKEILSTTTHDLRGPLGSISLCGEMLVDMVKAPEKAQELSRRVLTSAKGALNLIDGFLQARRLQEGTFVLHPTKNDVGALAENVVAEQQIIADSRGVKLTLTKSGQGTGMVDGLAFSRALQNLISNGIKYTERGGSVTVNLNVVAGLVTVSVADSGAGMEPAEAQRLFERFSRLSRHSHIEGSGLGLYLVKNIVSAHGGTVLVTSQPGKGSTFTLEFPAEPPVNDKGQILCLDFA